MRRCRRENQENFRIAERIGLDMPIRTIPITRSTLIGHDYWRSHRAIDEIEVYCDLLDILEHRRADQDKQGRKERATLLNVEAVIGSYALEIGMKSLWALDNPKGIVKELRHNIEKVHDGLKPGTVRLSEAPWTDKRGAGKSSEAV